MPNRNVYYFSISNIFNCPFIAHAQKKLSIMRHVSSCFNHMLTNNMDVATDVIIFLRQLPVDMENARHSVLSTCMAALEHWYLRKDNIVNLMNLLYERFIVFDAPYFYTNGLRTLLQEALRIKEAINNRIFEITVRRPTVECDMESGGMGRPRKLISREEIEFQFEIFRNWKMVARQLGVSAKTLLQRRIEFGIQVSYSTGPRYIQQHLHDIATKYLV